MAVRLSALRARRPLTLGRFLVLFCDRVLVDPRALRRVESLGQLKTQWPHRESNPRPSGLYHSVSTNYATACPAPPLSGEVSNNINGKIKLSVRPILCATSANIYFPNGVQVVSNIFLFISAVTDSIGRTCIPQTFLLFCCWRPRRILYWNMPRWNQW
jgi:hypothetical protein